MSDPEQFRRPLKKEDNATLVVIKINDEFAGCAGQQKP
jgi:hypothetical protein